MRVSRPPMPVPGQFITLAADGTHLINSITNKPVFMTGDAPQLLIVQVSDEDVETYLADRAARKFNALWVLAADNADQANAPKNFYGEVPFSGPDFTNPNEKYWAHVDHVVQRAQAYGITLLMNPAFVGLDAKGGYVESYLKTSDEVVKVFGEWVGARYKNYPNIIWQIGGDSNTVKNKGLKPKLLQLVTGLATTDTNHLITSEECPIGLCGVGFNSTLDVWDGSPWVGLNGNYAPYAYAQTQCAAQYSKLSTYPTVPPFHMEDWYEAEHAMTELQLRQEAYWEILSGCYLGRFFGNNAIWTMGGPKDVMGQTWQSQLGSPGSLGQQYLGKLMRSREHWLMVPDVNHTALISGYGWGTTISVAARSSDGQTIIVYIPNGNAATIKLDMGKLTSKGLQATGWWFNPRAGEATRIGTFPNTGERDFTAPDSNDWALVIDDATASLPAPGKSEETAERLRAIARNP